MWYSGLWIAVFVFCTVVIVLSMQYWLLKDARTKTLAGLAIVRNLIATEKDENTIHINVGDPDLVKAVAGGVMLQISGPNGDIISRSPALGRYILTPYAGEPVQTYWGREPVMTAGFYLSNHDIVQTIYPLSGMNQVLRILTWLFVAIGIGGVLLTLGLCWIVTRKVMRPLAVLTETVKNITAFGLDRRINMKVSYREMDILTDTFNNMLERLETSFRSQQEFVAFASHDLRTPLTIIKNYVQILSRWGLKDPTVCEEAFETIHNTISTTERWVNDLLLLLQVQGNHFMDKEKIRIDILLQDIVREARFLTDNTAIITCYAEQATVVANSGYLRRALWALLDNAIKYSGVDGQVSTEVRIDREKNMICVGITDFGPGISEEEQKKIFQPFYRSKNQMPGQGHGLGLALVQAVVTACGGTIYVQSKSGQGSSFFVILPPA
jgi:signal transduction histidine kinase